MSRLKKYYKKRAIIYGISIIIALYILFTLGLQLILNGSSLVAQLFGKKFIDTRNPVLQAVNITDIPSATNSATFIVSGNANNFDELRFYLNDQIVKRIDLSSGFGKFSEEIGTLQKGENKLYFLAKSSKGDKKSDDYTVLYRSDKPKLDVTDPKDGSKTNKDQTTVAGSTDKGIDIKINGLPVVVDANLHFQTTLKLSEGDNKIEITATDEVGNFDSKTLTVKYEKD